MDDNTLKKQKLNLLIYSLHVYFLSNYSKRHRGLSEISA